MVRLSDDIVHTVTALRRDLDMHLCGEWAWGCSSGPHVRIYIYIYCVYVHTYVTVYLSVIVIIAVHNNKYVYVKFWTALITSTCMYVLGH